jgi:hypothetical protein
LIVMCLLACGAATEVRNSEIGDAETNAEQD